MKKQLTQFWQVVCIGLVLALGGGRGAWAQGSVTYLYYRFEAVPKTACLGQPVRIVGTCSAGPLPLGDPGDSLFWTFGEGASVKKIHTPASITEYSISYLKPGRQGYSVTFYRKSSNGGAAIWSGGVQVHPSVDVRLGPDTAVCAAAAVRIAPRTPLPVGSTLRWIDGSQGASLTVTAPGTYWVDVTDPATGCTTHVSRTIRARADCGAGGSSGSGSGSGSGGSVAGPVGGFVPNIVIPNANSQNNTFQLIDLVAADWQLQVFNRWGREVFRQEQYDNRWAAAEQPAGIYYYLLRHAPSGQLRRGWVEVIK